MILFKEGSEGSEERTVADRDTLQLGTCGFGIDRKRSPIVLSGFPFGEKVYDVTINDQFDFGSIRRACGNGLNELRQQIDAGVDAKPTSRGSSAVRAAQMEIGDHINDTSNRSAHDQFPSLRVSPPEVDVRLRRPPQSQQSAVTVLAPAVKCRGVYHIVSVIFKRKGWNSRQRVRRRKFKFVPVRGALQRLLSHCRH